MSRHRASATVLPELAKGVHEIANRAAARAASVERFKVTGTSPLMIEEIEGDLVLEEGDPDFTIGAALSQHIATYGIEVDDVVMVSRAGGEYHALDAATAAEPSDAGQPLSSTPYVFTGAGAPTRTLNLEAPSIANVANVLAQLLKDLGGHA